ncbi:unnamed protein product [Mytilus coruscus]|uniref:HTH psq-type domain-containing protein n=1 Tax=Mytilus coruscus TaxID=42192 RepID=A0A6J8EZK7_MYTCO|nr:unnamed protein product [Mytilus coruscus]
MVDCGNSRCLQEKRSFKKELLSWSKKIPIAVGLERIAEELAGENVIKELLLPFNDLEKDEKEDWHQEQNCFFCESRLQMMFEAVEKLMEEVKSGKNLTDNPSLRYLQELLPYCPQFYTHNIGREILAELKTTGHGVERDVEMNIPQTQKEPIELKIPHVISHARQKVKESPQACKKSYTDDELTAAVNEIQSGKLGTRRASVLYGIPRSTLRNKIFRMGSDKPSIYSLNGDEGYEDALAAEIALKWTDLIQGSYRPLFIQQLPLMLNPDYKVIDSGDDFEKKLEYIRKKHNLGRKKEKYHSEYAHELRLPYLKKIIKKLTEERFDMERNAERVRKISKKDILKSQLAKSNVIEMPSLPSTEVSDIVIPSFKPAHDTKTEKQITEQLSHSFDKYENTRLGDTLKDIIVKTISEKVRVKSQALAEFCNSSLKTESDIIIKSEPQSPIPSPFKKIKREDYDRKLEHVEHMTKPLKKTRPKRGQYRKYNSQLLMEAVKAVQRGEMSVHRAGSYYGVPHSTLEYKVKERHLLRQKKIKEQKEAAARAAAAGTSNPVTNHSSNSNSSTGTDTEAITVKKEPEEEISSPKTTLSTSWMPSYFTSASNIAGTTDLNFFGTSGYALSTPASELLRKLQHKVQTKADESDSCSNSGEGYVYIH